MQATRRKPGKRPRFLPSLSLLCNLPAMLQRLCKLSGGLSAVGGSRAALPALARHVRMYGFGSHVSDNGEGVALPRSPARRKPCRLRLARPDLGCPLTCPADPEVTIGAACGRSEAWPAPVGQLPASCKPLCCPALTSCPSPPTPRRSWSGRSSGTSKVRPGGSRRRRHRRGSCPPMHPSHPSLQARRSRTSSRCRAGASGWPPTPRRW